MKRTERIRTLARRANPAELLASGTFELRRALDLLARPRADRTVSGPRPASLTVDRERPDSHR